MWVGRWQDGTSWTINVRSASPNHKVTFPQWSCAGPLSDLIDDKTQTVRCNHNRRESCDVCDHLQFCCFVSSNCNFLDTQVSLAPQVILLNFQSVSVSGPSQNVRRDLWPFRHLIRVMRRNDPGVYGGLNASRVGLYGGSNAQKCIMAAVLCKKYTDG